MRYTIDNILEKGDRMSGSKASVIEKINRMPDEMNEFELIERLPMHLGRYYFK